MLNEEIIKQIYFCCDEKLPGAIYADDLDIIQFAHRIAEFVEPIIAAKEHERCVKIVSDMNPAVGNSLSSQRPKPT